MKADEKELFSAKVMTKVESNTNFNSNFNSNANKQVWMNKLKPSMKNRSIHKKYKILNDPIFEGGTVELNNYLGMEKAEFDKNAENAFIKSNENFEDKNQNEKDQSILPQKWDIYVKLSKQTKDLDFNNQSIVMNIRDSELNTSLLSENLQEINNIIEEKFKIAITENIFLRGEYHSIIPFLLISSKEVHRMILSDYEIKEIIHTFLKKAKMKKLDSFDYYRMGLINFYKGCYANAYTNFKIAYKLVTCNTNLQVQDSSHLGYNINFNTIINISKWLAFAGLIILFCPNKIIDFSNLKNLKLVEEFTAKEKENYNSFIVSCCSARKTNTKVNVVQAEKDIEIYNFNNTSNDSIMNKIDINSLASEIEDLLSKIIENSPNSLEGWWMKMYIDIYCKINKNQKFFKNCSDKYTPPDPKYCVKKIKQIDGYLAYIAFAEMNVILDEENYRIDEILSELIYKFKHKCEAYLKFWQLLIKKESKFKNYKKAHAIAELFWKMSSNLKFDENEKSVYYFYILITYAKSSYLIGNSVYTISFYQKEYASNFLYPTIFYLFGKNASKSNSKNLKTTAISSLQEVYRLLNEDLQLTTLYWLGNIYHNIGNYESCYKIWKLYLENSEKSFNPGNKKIQRIYNFFKQYELLCDNLIQFKKNINSAKKCTSKIELTEIENYFADLDLLRKIMPNIKYKYLLTYEYYKGLIFSSVVKNYEESIRLFTNIINEDNYYMPASFSLWKIINRMKNVVNPSLANNILLKFSYFMIKIAQNEEVCFSDWIKTFIYYSKALYLNNKYEQAIQVLICLLDIFANMPNEDIKFLNEINKDNNISVTNVFVNFELALKFYSKFHVYKKCEDIFLENYLKKEFALDDFNTGLNTNFLEDLDKKVETNSLSSNEKEDDFNNIRSLGNTLIKSNIQLTNKNENPDDNKITASGLKTVDDLYGLSYESEDENLSKNQNDDIVIIKNTSNLIIDQNFIDLSQFNNLVKEDALEKDTEKFSNFENKKVPDLNIKTITKLEEFIDNNIDNIEIQKDNFTFITIISNPIILYEIGKLCAKTKAKLELGLMCFDDFNFILKFQNNYKLTYYHDKKKLLAKFWKGVIYLLLCNINAAKDIFEKIYKFLEVYGNESKLNLINRFFEYHSKIIFTKEINNKQGGEINEDFEISLEELKNL